MVNPRTDYSLMVNSGHWTMEQMKSIRLLLSTFNLEQLVTIGLLSKKIAEEAGSGEVDIVIKDGKPTEIRTVVNKNFSSN